MTDAPAGHRTLLQWMWGRGFRFLFVIDAISLFALMVTINFVRFGWVWPTYPRSHYWIGFGVATAIHLTVNYLAGLYEREPRLGYRSWLPRVATATAIAVGLDGVAAVLSGRFLMPRLNLAVLLVTGTIVLTANRRLSRWMAARHRGPNRLVLVGSGEAARLAEHHFRKDDDSNVVARTDDIDDVIDLVAEHRATEVLLLELAAFNDAVPEPVTELDDSGVGVHQRVGARETLLGLQSVREIAGMPFTRMRTHAMASHQLRLKRAFDLVVVIAFAPMALAVGAGVALYVRMKAGPGVLYRQCRVGFRGQPFDVIKFRTMSHDAEADGIARLSGEDDDRVVPSLRWLRQTRLDELPQLVNVLRGEMSLVGPRPERPEIVLGIEAEVDGYARRHELPPGMTGLAQVNGRYETDAVFKLGYDLQYLVNWSLVLDLQILARTVWVIVRRRV